MADATGRLAEYPHAMDAVVGGIYAGSGQPQVAVAYRHSEAALPPLKMGETALGHEDYACRCGPSVSPSHRPAAGGGRLLPAFGSDVKDYAPHEQDGWFRVRQVIDMRVTLKY